MDRLRVPLFIIALILLLLALFLELGSPGLARFLAQFIDSSSLAKGARASSPPGMAVGFESFFDGLLMLSVGLMGLALLIPDWLHARIQGIIGLLVSLGIAIGSIVAIFAALTKLILMVMLLFAPIFGTIAYFAMFASFPVNSARSLLSLIMLFKFGFAIMLVFAHQRFLLNINLVVMVLVSFLITFIVSFLHGIVPGFLVSITDAIAAIIVCIIALIWAVISLIGCIISIIKTIRISG